MKLLLTKGQHPVIDQVNNAAGLHVEWIAIQSPCELALIKRGRELAANVRAYWANLSKCAATSACSATAAPLLGLWGCSLAQVCYSGGAFHEPIGIAMDPVQQRGYGGRDGTWFYFRQKMAGYRAIIHLSTVINIMFYILINTVHDITCIRHRV